MARTVWATLQPHTKKELKESDFLLQFGKQNQPAEYPSWEVLKQKAMLLTAAAGGKIIS